jgi:hypothetical protein
VPRGDGVDGSGRRLDGRSRGRTGGARQRGLASEVEETDELCRIVKSGKITKTFTPDELKAIKLKTADQYTMIGVSVPQLDIPRRPTAPPNTASTSCCRAWSTARS